MPRSLFAIQLAAICFGCSTAPPPSTNGDKNADPIGTFRLDTPSAGGELRILEASTQRLVFSLSVQSRVSSALAIIDEGIAEPTDGGELVHWPFAAPADCELAFTALSADAVTMVQTGECHDFGAFIDVSGTYTSVDAAPAPGAYVLDEESAGGTLHVLEASAERVLFDLSVQLRFGANGHAIIDQGEAEPTEGGRLVYWPDNMPGDCEIAFTSFDAQSITLNQVGECEDFGAFVDVSGTYSLQPEPQPLEGNYQRSDGQRDIQLMLFLAEPERILFELSLLTESEPDIVINWGEALPTPSGALSYQPEDDCEIVFTELSPERMSLSQRGACASLPSDTDLSGEYLRQPTADED